MGVAYISEINYEKLVAEHKHTNQTKIIKQTANDMLAFIIITTLIYSVVQKSNSFITFENI